MIKRLNLRVQKEPEDVQLNAFLSDAGITDDQIISIQIIDTSNDMKRNCVATTYEHILIWYKTT